MTSLEQARLQVARDLITLAQRDAVAMRVLAEVPEKTSSRRNRSSRRGACAVRLGYKVSTCLY
jgi:hypothetical protein